MPPRTSSRAAAALVAAALLVLAACSSSGSDDGATKADGTTTSAAQGGSGTDDGSGDAPSATGKPLERYADYETKEYDDPSHWVCRPDITDDICDGDLTATQVDADGTLTEEPFEPAKDPEIDCFYVYPTISRDKSNYSDWEASPDEEGFVTLNQAARLQSECRLFAPVYRQGTLSGLTGRLAGGDNPYTDEGDPYADVEDAFRTYMAEDNHGRGFVLIGHSQGTGMLNQLIQKEIDPNEDVRAKLVGAYLAGGAVAVPEGKLVGGDFEHVPLCSKDGETGCVATWATFRSTAPPPSGSFFGKPRGGEEGEVAGCVSPADMSGKKGDVAASAYFPSNGRASILGDLGASTEGGSWLEDPEAELDTPFASVPGLASVTCVSKDGFTYLQATVLPDSGGPRLDDIPGDITPEWGLHLIDVNLVMGDIVRQVGKQAKTYSG